MRRSKPSVTARHVALTRASFDRPVLPTGDAEAELRLYRSLGASRLPRTDSFARRLERRTKFFDGETVRAIGRGIEQIVIVAAGYDGRALRFATPEVRFFEVDHPATQADKRARLASARVDATGVTFVPVDLTKDDLVAALGGARHDPQRPSLFVIEGLFGYLSRSDGARLLSSARELAAGGSRLSAAFPTLPADASLAEKLRLRLRATLVSAIGEPWLVRYDPDELDGLLEKTGWRVAASQRPDGGLVRYEGRQGVLLSAVPAPRS